MKKQLWSTLMLCTLGLMGCGEEASPTPGNNPDTGPKYNTPAKINAGLVGKTLVMTGADIPGFPNGLDEDVDNGAASQCYQSVTMTVEDELHYRVVSKLGTLRNVDPTTKRGECDHSVVSNQLEFTSRGVLIENVAADGSCFDVTFQYQGFQQEGRGVLSQDGKTLKVELFFQNLATGHRCADGAVGAKTVIVGGAPFAGNAVQTYAIQ